MVDPVTISGLFSVGKSLIERIWPDPQKQAEELRKLEALKQKGDLAELNAHVQIMVGQMEINKAEAQHKSVFVAGWRPFIGWVGGCALAWQFIVYPIMGWLWAIGLARGWIPTNIAMPPMIEAGELYTIILGMLGIGAMRSYDKKNGTATHSINSKQG